MFSNENLNIKNLNGLHWCKAFLLPAHKTTIDETIITVFPIVLEKVITRFLKN